MTIRQTIIQQKKNREKNNFKPRTEKNCSALENDSKSSFDVENISTDEKEV